jgi:beta-glucosidase
LKRKVSPRHVDAPGINLVHIDFTNTGKVNGDEVVQLYVRDLVSSLTVYENRLRRFERVNLNPGETKTAVFTMTPEGLELLDSEMNWDAEPGEFEICIGSSSEDIRLRKTFFFER